MASTFIGIDFPSEADALSERLEVEAHLTPDEKFRALLDTLSVAESFSRAGEIRPRQIAYHARMEEDWQVRMKEFISKQPHGSDR